MFCQICGKHLYEKISFNTLFLLNYNVHEKCKNLLQEEVKTLIIPIDSNEIEFMYIFQEKAYLNYKYLHFHVAHKLYEKVIGFKDWSVVFWYDDFDILTSEELQMLLHFGKKKIIFLSMKEL